MRPGYQRFFVKPTSLRPDYRLVLTFLWDDDRNCDTDGNSRNPASREWTELYCCNRENAAEVFDVSPLNQEPLVLEVESPYEWVAARVAYFLAVESAGLVADKPDGHYGGPDMLISKLGEFDIEAGKERVRQSVFRGATLEDPYPNLRRRRGG
jgi:hypothetical protein